MVYYNTVHDDTWPCIQIKIWTINLGFFLMKKIQSKKNIGRLEETAVFVGLSEII